MSVLLEFLATLDTMRTFSFALALLAVLGTAGVAWRGVSAAAPAARDAQAIVRALEARYHSATTLKAAFLERYREGGRDVRLESGTVYFRRPGGMRWEYESPEEKLFVADGNTVWFYVPADRTVTRARMKQSTDWRTPLALLTGKAKLSRICGRIELADAGPGSSDRSPGDVPRVVKGHAVLRCLPRAESRGSPRERDSFQEVLLEVDAASGELASVLIRQGGGIEIEYRFGNWQQNLPLPEAMFHFQSPVGVAIVDESSIGGPLR